MRAGRDHEAAEVVAVQLSVTIGCGGGVETGPGRVGGKQLALVVVAQPGGLACHAAHAIQAAMQVDDAPAAGVLVQAVDILRHQQADLATPLELSQGAVRGIRQHGAEARPTQHAACPVALAHQRFVHERGIHDRRGRALPLSVAVAVIGNARVGAATGAGQHEQPRMDGNELLQVGHHLHMGMPRRE